MRVGFAHVTEDFTRQERVVARLQAWAATLAPDNTWSGLHVQQVLNLANPDTVLIRASHTANMLAQHGFLTEWCRVMMWVFDAERLLGR